jgi:hypothetical protein
MVSLQGFCKPGALRKRQSVMAITSPQQKLRRMTTRATELRFFLQMPSLPIAPGLLVSGRLAACTVLFVRVLAAYLSMMVQGRLLVKFDDLAELLLSQPRPGFNFMAIDEAGDSEHGATFPALPIGTIT